MYLYQLQDFVNRKIGNYNIFVVPWDLLPRSFKLPAGFIVNLSPSTHKGTHWIAISIDRQRRGFYFDSYGFKPTTPAIKNFLEKYCRTYEYNPHQLQQETSDTCGKYAAMFLLAFFKGLSPEQFISDFTANPWHNDNIINEMYRKYSSM